jgi:hypothetical protein
VALYVRATNLQPVVDANGNPIIDTSPLTRSEIATIDAEFLRRKNYYRSMINVERACFDAVDACINDAFKVSNDPTIVGWHAGMSVMTILDGLSTLYGKPTPTALEGNDKRFCSPYSPADPPKILFRRIEDCAKIALLGRDPYTDRQPINTATRLLASTGLYIRAFEDWDLLAPVDQTWIALRALIQTAFQRRLNATAPTAGYYRYAPMMPHQQHGGQRR